MNHLTAITPIEHDSKGETKQQAINSTEFLKTSCNSCLADTLLTLKAKKFISKYACVHHVDTKVIISDHHLNSVLPHGLTLARHPIEVYYTALLLIACCADCTAWSRARVPVNGMGWAPHCATFCLGRAWNWPVPWYTTKPLSEPERILVSQR